MLTNITLNNYTTFINETIFDFNAINYESLKKQMLIQIKF